MRIVGLRVREVSIPRIYDTYEGNLQSDPSQADASRSRYQIIEVRTDDGHVGLGEVSDIAQRMRPPSPEELKGILAATILGAEVTSWRAICSNVSRTLPTNWHPELRGLTLFGIEISLLDLIGQKYNVPLFELLGGRYRECVHVCWVAYQRGDIPLDDELAAFEEEMRQKVAEGFRAFKIKVGGDHEKDLARIKLFRTVAGPGIHLRVDASGVWEEAEAIRKLADMAACGINACETPVTAVNRRIANNNPERINANADAAAKSLARVRAASPVEIIEHVGDLGDVFSAALVRHRAVDCVNVIPSQAGGVLRGKRLIHAAETAGIHCLLGSTVELGPGTAASIHLGVASKNVSVPSDLVSPGLLVDDVCKSPFRFDIGTLRPFEKPGLGVELDEAKMEKWAVQKDSLS